MTTVQAGKIEVVPLDTANLGNRSYLVHDGRVAVAVDPPRDVDRVVAVAALAERQSEGRGVRIELVLDTHGHGDWLTGGPALAQLVGARYGAPAEVGGERRDFTITDGQEFTVGNIRLRARHSPGHTLGHISYELIDDDQVVGVFSGGSMLHGAVGRPDLLGPEHTEELAHAQYHSVRRMAEELPDDAQVLPMHGFGSFCSATPTSGTSSTIADQRTTNPALTQDEQSFVDQLLAGLDVYPAFYARMGPGNMAGPGMIDLTPPRIAEPAEIRKRIESGEWVVDLRSRTAFAAGHLPGTYSFDGHANVVTYLGWLIPVDAPLTLLGETAEQVADVQRELAMIGIEHPAASATGDVKDWADGAPLASFENVTFEQLPARLETHPDDTVVLDVRLMREWRDGHLQGAIHIPMHELPDRISELPPGEVWVHCGSGFRAAVAASLLERAGRQNVVMIDDDFSNAASAGCQVVTDDK